MTIYALLEEKTMEEIEKEFAGKGYGDFKTAVAEAIVKKLEPLQQKYCELLENPEKLKAIYEKGAKKAAKRANQIVNDVYQKVGLIVDE